MLPTTASNANDINFNAQKYNYVYFEFHENSLFFFHPPGKYSISVSLFFLFIFSRNLRNNLNKILKLLPLVTIIMSLPPKLKLMGKQQKMKKNIPVWIRPEIQPNQIFLVILLSATTAMEPLQSPPRSSVVMKASKRELLIWTYPSKPKMKKNSWMCKYLMKNINFLLQCPG